VRYETAIRARFSRMIAVRMIRRYHYRSDEVPPLGVVEHGMRDKQIVYSDQTGVPSFGTTCKRN